MAITKKDEDKIRKIAREEAIETIETVFTSIFPFNLPTKNPELVRSDVARWDEYAIPAITAGVEIAPNDYWELDDKCERKDHFTWYEAKEIETKLAIRGWRLPTRSEWVAIVEEFGNDYPSGLLSPKQLKTSLGLNIDDTRYISSTKRNNISEHCLFIHDDQDNPIVDPNDSVLEDNKLRVRLVRDVCSGLRE